MHNPNSRRSRRRTLAAACALSVPIIAGFADAARAQEAPGNTMPSGPLVTLDVRDARLPDVIQMLTLKTGLNIVIRPGISDKGYSPVTLKISDRPLDQVLRAVASSAGAVVTNEDGIYFLRPAGAEPAPVTPAAPPAPSLDPATTVVVPFSAAPATQSMRASRGYRQMVKIPLIFIKPSVVRDFLMTSPEILTLDQDPIRDQINQTNQIKGRPAYPTIPLANPVPIGPTIDNPAAAGGYFGGRGGDVSGGSDSILQFPGGGGRGGGRGGGLNGGGGGLQGGGGGGLQGGGGQGGQNGQTANLLPENVDPPIAYDIDNSLLVTGDPEGLEQLRSLIRLLDIPPKQVQIRAEFVDVQISDADSFGIQWNIKPANNISLDLPALGEANSLSIIAATGNAVAQLRQSVLKTTTNVLQAPIITTTNLVPAVIQVSTQIPVFSTVQQVTNGGTVVNVPVIQQATVSNGLTVLPRINGDNSVTLQLSPQISNFTIITGPGGNQAPQISQSSLSTYRRVANGETMVLGGFITKTETKSTNRTPFLSDLPIIGSLFRSRNRTVQGSETLIFVTPTIIEDRATGTSGGGAPSP